VAGQQEDGLKWLVLTGAVVLVLAVSVATWWRIGDRYSSLGPCAVRLIPPFPRQPGSRTGGGQGAVLAAIVAAMRLTWASLQHGSDVRWWSVLGPLLPAGVLAGFIWRVITTRLGGPVGLGCVYGAACPVLLALLGWTVTRSLRLL
jgi:hypothetical protein